MSINTAKERYYGMQYFKEHVMPPDFDYRKSRKVLSPYFLKHGFEVSMMYNDFYSHYSGIESDRYVSMDLAYFYIFPCLCRYDMLPAYTDKNNFSVLFPDIRQPETILKCRNGIYYTPDEKPIPYTDALTYLLTIRDACIIKPTVNTCNGDGVASLKNEDKGILEAQVKSYRLNFIIQKKCEQHADLARLNPTSLNTYRLFTYRDRFKKIHFLGAPSCLRIGGKGAIRDNASSGGVICFINTDATIKPQAIRFKQWAIETIESIYHVAPSSAPSLSKAVQLIVRLHESLPFFDYIGWDIAISPNNEPVLIEFNPISGIEIPQFGTGPLFGEHLDEVMERVKCVKKEKKLFSINSFPTGSEHFLHIG